MNFKAAIETINKDFCNVFLAMYLKDQWGIVAGFNTVPVSLAVMRKDIADWQVMNCDNEWCSMVSTSGVTCPPGYDFIDDPVYGPFCSKGGCPPGANPVTTGGVVNCVACTVLNPCPPPAFTLADVTISSYGSQAPAGSCVLNPVMDSGTCRRHWRTMNVNEILIGSFTR